MEYISILREHFGEPVFQIAYDKEKDQYVVHREMVVPNRQTREPESKDIHCIEFTLDHSTRELVIKLVLNCSIDLEYIGRGKDIIDRIIKLSNHIGYTAIIEYDVSKIAVHGVEFSLRKLKLLSSGKTWYQSMGFYEEGHLENAACIEGFISKQQPKSGGKTVKAYFAEVMETLAKFSKKDRLDDSELAELKRLNSQVTYKFRQLEKECPNTYKNFTDLRYMKREPGKQSVSNSKSKRSRSSSRSSTKKKRRKL